MFGEKPGCKDMLENKLKARGGNPLRTWRGQKWGGHVRLLGRGGVDTFERPHLKRRRPNLICSHLRKTSSGWVLNIFIQALKGLEKQRGPKPHLSSQKDPGPTSNHRGWSQFKETVSLLSRDGHCGLSKAKSRHSLNNNTAKHARRQC